MIERAVVDAAAALRQACEPYLVATVMRVDGSAYRRAGARVLLSGDRRVAGAISGGCLEGDVAMRGWWRTRAGEPVVVTYDSRVDDDADDDEIRSAFAVGCNGVIDVLLERVEPGARTIDPLIFARRCIRTQQRGGVATIYRTSSPALAAWVGTRLALPAGGELIIDPNFPATAARATIAADLSGAIADATSRTHVYAVDGGHIEVLLEVMVPPPRVFVFGAGPDAVPVVGLARELGWDAVVCVPGATTGVRTRFARADELVIGAPAALAAHVNTAERAVAVVMAHDYELDRAHLGMLLDTRAIYIGALGPRRRTDRMLADLGVDARRDDPRLHAPVGLELGAETPQEIALAVTAEIQAVVTGVPQRNLRDRVGAIHDGHDDHDDHDGHGGDTATLATDTVAARTACAAAGG